LNVALQEPSFDNDELSITIDTIPMLVWRCRTDGTAEFLNQRWLDYTGYSLDQGLEWGWKDAVHPDDLPGLMDIWRTVLMSRAGGEAEARIRRHDGVYRWFLFRAEPQFDDFGSVLKWCGTNIDIEDRKRAEESLLQTQAQLAHVTRVITLGELAASIAHEVNQPLAAITTHGQSALLWLAQDGPAGREETRLALQHIVEEARRAGAIIHGIRDLATKSNPHFVPLGVNDVIEDVVTLVGRIAHENKVTLSLQLASGLPAVLGDCIQLQQVIINLLINGVEAMSAVSVGLRELSIKSTSYQDDQVLVAVTDRGGGFDPGDAKRVFDAFFSTKSHGMGMGLSICRSIVEAHGGRIWARNNASAGATFQFTLKRYQGPNT
jgi:PAS domain S-box-containing protein